MTCTDIRTPAHRPVSAPASPQTPPPHTLCQQGREQVRLKLNALGQQRIPCFFLISFDFSRHLLCPLAAMDERVQFVLPGFRHTRTDHHPLPQGVRQWSAAPMELAHYARAFRTVQEHMAAGDTYLLNLTASTPVACDWSLEQIFHRAQAPFRLYLQDEFTCFSPERFVRIQDTTIETFPMKGTADATIPGAAAALLANPKEISEHTMIVDLLRNDLSCVARRVRVERFRYLESISSGRGRLLQTSSHICGDLPASWPDQLGDILCNMLPAGSVSGTPKLKTMEIIKAVELHERGYFTGVFGYFDGSSVDSAVLIRFLERTPSGLVFKSGGGLTAESDLVDEYTEMCRKVYVPVT